MQVATTPAQRPSDAKLLLVDAGGRMEHRPRVHLAACGRAGDLVVANDAATIPASLRGVLRRSGAVVEIRLAGRRSLAVDDIREVAAVIFGSGDHRTRTEDRPPPPPLSPGDVLDLGPLEATVVRPLGHPRLLAVRFAGSPEEIWSGILRHGQPVQYAHLQEPLAIWDVWTRVAALPAAFEPPSAGFLLDWKLLQELRTRGIGFATLTHAAGLSSTGDPTLDARLPLDEPYRIPETTARAITRVRAAGGRIIALGTTVTRALEHAASPSGTLRAGAGLATQRIGPATRLCIVDAIVTGIHEPGESHYTLLRAFANDRVLAAMGQQLEQYGYRTHEFGDSVLVERAIWRSSSRPEL